MCKSRSCEGIPSCLWLNVLSTHMGENENWEKLVNYVKLNIFSIPEDRFTNEVWTLSQLHALETQCSPVTCQSMNCVS